MKTLILVVLLLFPIIHGKAENYYTDYSDWKEVETVPKLDQDLLEVKEEKQYKWYLKKREGKYFDVLDNHTEYPYQTDFFTFSEWSNWSEQKPVTTEFMELETRNVYYYQTMKKIRFIRLSQIETEDLEFTNIHIYNGEKEIQFVQKVKGDTILFELSEPCYADLLEINFTMIEVSELPKHFTIEWLYDLETIEHFETYSVFWFQGAYEAQYRYHDMAEKNLLWEEIRSSLEKIPNSVHCSVWKVEEYRYRNKLFYYEKEIREYSDSYSSLPLEKYPYPDLETEKTVFKIRTRERRNIKEKVKEIVKEKPIVKTIVKEESNKKAQLLEQDLKKAKGTIVSLQNEQSRKLESQSCKKVVENKNGFRKSIYLFLFLLLGFLLGRILASKKKF